MKNIVLKIREGDLFRFIDSEERTQLTIGSKRGADICIRSPYVQSEQAKLLLRNGVWYAEDLTSEEGKCQLLLGKKPFKKPLVRLDGTLTLRKKGEKKEKAKIRKTEKSGGKEAIRRNLLCAFARNSS